MSKRPDRSAFRIVGGLCVAAALLAGTTGCEELLGGYGYGYYDYSYGGSVVGPYSSGHGDDYMYSNWLTDTTISGDLNDGGYISFGDGTFYP